MGPHLEGKSAKEYAIELYNKKGPDFLDGQSLLNELVELHGCGVYIGTSARPTLYGIQWEGLRWLIDCNKSNISVIQKDPNWRPPENYDPNNVKPCVVDYYEHREMGLTKLTLADCKKFGIKSYFLANMHWKSKESALKLEYALQ